MATTKSLWRHKNPELYISLDRLTIACHGISLFASTAHKRCIDCIWHSGKRPRFISVYPCNFGHERLSKAGIPGTAKMSSSTDIFPQSLKTKLCLPPLDHKFSVNPYWVNIFNHFPSLFGQSPACLQLHGILRGILPSVCLSHWQWFKAKTSSWCSAAVWVLL